MGSNKAVREVPEMSPDPRVWVFRRILSELEEFGDMEVDAYIVIGERYVVLLDTLLCPDDVDAMLDPITPALFERQLLCVNSHADWDHSWGNSYFSDKTESISILAHEACRQRLLSQKAQQELEEYQARYLVFEFVSLEPPTLTFRETFTIYDPQWTMELLHAPGHCQDQIVAWLPEIRLLLAFDAIEYPVPCIEEAACAPQMFSTLERLAALDAQHVLCSHSKNASPALIRENLAYMREIERRARLLLEKHVPMKTELEQAAELIGYPFDEVIANVTEKRDLAYYGDVHEQNVRAILEWLMVE